MEIINSFKEMFSVEHIFQTLGYFGYLAIFAIVFAESGLLIGFFLPGDSLLLTAGILSSPASIITLKKLGIAFELNVHFLALGCFVSAVLGDTFGYVFGKKMGKRLFQKEDSILFHKDNLLRAQEFYEKHGGKAIIIARFIPIVRTFAPIVAGIGNMEYKTFLFYNLFGGLLWSVGFIYVGYFLGSVPNIEKYIHYIVFVIIIGSILPPVYHVFKEKKSRDALLDLIKKIFVKK